MDKFTQLLSFVQELFDYQIVRANVFNIYQASSFYQHVLIVCELDLPGGICSPRLQGNVSLAQATP